MPKIFTTNTLCANVYKVYKCVSNQMPYCNVKSFKKSSFWEFWAIDKTWLTLNKFYYFTFTSENNVYFKGLHKIWNKIISFDMRKKGKWKTCHGKSEKKVNLGVLGMNFYVLGGVFQSCLNPVEDFGECCWVFTFVVLSFRIHVLKRLVSCDIFSHSPSTSL